MVKDLIQKLATLLPLPDLSRYSEACYLNITYMAKTYRSYILFFDKLIDRYNKGEESLSVEYSNFAEIKSCLLQKTLIHICIFWKTKEILLQFCNF